VAADEPAGEDDEKQGGREDADGGYDGAGQAEDEVAGEGGHDDHGAGADEAHGDGVDELLLGQPAVGLHEAVPQERDDRQARAEGR